MSKIREKESLECVRMHIWASKTQKLPGPLSGPWTPAAECLLRSCDSASLCRQLSASEAGAPPWPNPGSAPALSIAQAHSSMSIYQISKQACPHEVTFQWMIYIFQNCICNKILYLNFEGKCFVLVAKFTRWKEVIWIANVAVIRGGCVM